MPQHRLPWKSGNEATTWSTLQGKPATFTPPAATTAAAGGVKQMAKIAPLAAAPTQADINGLLTALTAAGIMSAT